MIVGGRMAMRLCDDNTFNRDVNYAANFDLPWENLQDKTVLVSGATGLIGGFLLAVIMKRNVEQGLNCKIYALGRSRKKAMERFAGYFQQKKFFEFVAADVNCPLGSINVGKLDYVLHLASPTHPVAYVKDPIGTISANIIGTKNMLDMCLAHRAERFVFASSNEIYGENRGDVELFDEKYCGYIDCNTLRAGYTESKRCGEALCQAYIKQRNMDIVIPRLTRSYGATLLSDDTKAASQFILKAVHDENIVLKSSGEQYYSYMYVADAVTGLLTVMLKGKCGEAYNIADKASDIRLKDLAALIAQKSGKKVVYELPDEIEKAGYSTATKARLDSTKLQKLGWKAGYSIDKGIDNTLRIIKNLIENG